MADKLPITRDPRIARWIDLGLDELDRELSPAEQAELADLDRWVFAELEFAAPLPPLPPAAPTPEPR